MELYERKLAQLPVAWESRMVGSRFGPTHVLVAGPPEAPPLLVLAGVHAGAPRMLELFLPLTQEYRVYAPDTIGQPGRSAPTRPLAREHNYGKWTVDVLDGLDLERPAFVGVSFGGGILLDTAAYAPKRLGQALLVVPAGIAAGSAIAIFLKLFLPWLVYRLFPSPHRLRQAVHPIMEDDEELLQFFDAVIRHVRYAVQPPGPFSKADLLEFLSPTLVLLAKEDIFFPVAQAARRAREIIPNLKAIEILEGPHVPAKRVRDYLNQRIIRFLKETAGNLAAEC